jgi:hypothetical protein
VGGADVDLAEREAIRVRMLPFLDDERRNDFFESLSLGFEFLDLESARGQEIRELLRGERERNEFFQPGIGNFHRESPKL